MEIRCKGRVTIGRVKQKCRKKLFINKDAKGTIEIKCPKCHRVQSINLEG